MQKFLFFFFFFFEVDHKTHSVKLVCSIFVFIIWLCLTRTGNYRIHEFDWLKSMLTLASRPVTFCGEKLAN